MTTHIKPHSISKHLEVNVDQISESLTLKITCNIDSFDPIHKIKGRAHLIGKDQSNDLNDTNKVYLIPEAYSFLINYNLTYKGDFTIKVGLNRFNELFTIKDKNGYLAFVLSFYYHDPDSILLEDVTYYDLKNLPVDL